jgi:IS605 OrfB family transposase
MKTVITGTIHQGDFEFLKQLMRDFSSCVRYAYQRIHKDKITYKNDIVKSCKPIYMPKLNQRYIQDAVMKAKDINQEHALFGGKKNWKDMLSGLLPKKDWQDIRDNEVYSRGDRTKSGNPNIRVLSTPEGYKLRVGLSKAREFITFHLYIPEKFKEQFELYKECYDVRIKHKGTKFYVMIGIDIPDVPVLYKLSNGAIGVDTNPDGLGVVDLDREGNLISHEYLMSQRLPFAKHDKRQHDVEALAIQVVNKAILANKGIVVEDLKFNDGKHGKRKFNRMRHNFIYSQLLRAIERRALKDGVEVKKINPAFTSIAGILKYQEMYSLNRHTAAALVIGRRGMGIMEKIRVRVEPLKNKKLNLAGRGFKIALTLKAYSYFRHLYKVLEVKTPVVTPPCLNSIQWNHGTS